MRRSFALAAAVFALACFALACSPAPFVAAHAPIDTDGKNFRGSDGRARIFRGVNVHIAGIFDVTFDDGRAPREPLPTFDAGDPAAMRGYGFNLVRLPIDWSAIEPTEGQFSTAYLDSVQHIVDLCRAEGILVLIDLHQDGYSKELCEDGAPSWAIIPPPATTFSGPYPGPGDCHVVDGAQKAFASFFADTSMLQERYAAMLQKVAARFAADDDVIGYEIMNEPIGATDDVIADFSRRMALAIRGADKKKLIVFEPSATRNFTNSSPIPAAPFAVDGGVYAVHVYSGVFGDPGPLMNGTFGPALDDSIGGARMEADGWGTPLVVTEFGLGSETPNNTQWISRALDDYDAQLASWTWWLWRDPAVGGWGLFDPQPDGSYTPRPAMLDALSRPYVTAVGGDPVAMKWDGATLTLTFDGRGGVPAKHDVFWNRGAPTIMCDGKAIAATGPAVTTNGSVYTIDSTGTCGGGGRHTLTLK
jgi:endoglycosylceramidase